MRCNPLYASPSVPTRRSSDLGGGKLCSECRGPDIPRTTAFERAQKGFARNRQKHRQIEAQPQFIEPRQHRERGFGSSPQKKPHAGIKDKAVAFDTGTRQRRDARVKERRNVIHDVASGCLAPICLHVPSNSCSNRRLPIRYGASTLCTIASGMDGAFGCST